jgi:LysM repeat protein
VTWTNPPEDGGYYRVRKSWADKASQKGAFKVLDNAKACADQNPGYSVYDEAGKAIYPSSQPAAATYTVAKGDTLWGIAAEKLGSGARYTEIMALNGLKTNTINPGQVLKLPE